MCSKISIVDFSGFTVQVPEGADHVPGLAEALDKARR
jgi:hypothetical protein